MVRVIVDNAKGLHQKSGNGMDINSEIQLSEGLSVLKEGVSQIGHTGLIVGKGQSRHAAADPYTESATQLWPLGTRMVYGDRQFVYALNGGSGITAGKLVQSAVHQGADHKNMETTAAVSAGSYTISIETNGTDLTKDQYAGGYLYVNDGTGQGQLFKIKSHAAHSHSGDPTCVFTLYDPVVTALASGATSEVTIHQNKQYKVVVSAHAQTASVVGATVIDLTADYYGWLQVSGPAALLALGSLVVGQHATRSTATTAGAVQPAGNDVSTIVGEVMIPHTAGENALIDMRIGF